MSKLRADSTWAGLTPEQRETMEVWLFEENLGYDEALERAQKEFGIAGSKMSLLRFYQHLARERMRRDFTDVKTMLAEVKGAEVNWQEVGGAAMALIARRMLQVAAESPHKLKELAALGRVLVSNEAQNIRRGWLAIGREKFQYDIATACLMHKLELDMIEKDDGLNDVQRIQKVREELFGPNLPD